MQQYQDAIAGFPGIDGQIWTNDECVDVLLHLMDEYPAVTLILDALDEMNPVDRQELLDVLTCILQETSTLVKAFIPSRDSQDMTPYLSGTPHVHIKPDDNVADSSSHNQVQG